MASADTSDLTARYTRYAAWPGGGWLFDRVLGWIAPYTGSIRPHVQTLAPGQVVVEIRDRRAVRNHLRTVHAAALMNLGELANNLALMSRQPAHGRWIVAGVEVDYQRPARGRLSARCTLPEIDWTRSQELAGEAEIVDGSGERVAVVRTRWKVGPKRARAVAEPGAAAA